MFAMLLVLFTLGGDEPRQPNPLAPSLPLLNKDEIKRYDTIVDRFIEFDIGKLKGPEGKKAASDFNRLPAEAIFNLIDGFNRAADMEHSCPAVIIGRKILSIMNASQDLELLAFAKENVGAGVTAKRHQGMIREVQFGILLRKGTVQRLNLAGGGIKSGGPGSNLASLSLADLIKKADKDQGPQLKKALAEIETRQGAKALETLAIAATHEDGDIQKFSKELLAKRMIRQEQGQLKDQLKHEKAEVRLAAVNEVGSRKLRFGNELIDLLNDSAPAVQQAARQALMRITGVDHGPAADASIGDRQAAQRRWRQWFDTQKK